MHFSKAVPDKKDKHDPGERLTRKNVNDHVELIIKDGNLPEITVNGNHFWIISCSYVYYTETEKSVIQQLVANGYIDGEATITTIYYDYQINDVTIRKD